MQTYTKTFNFPTFDEWYKHLSVSKYIPFTISIGSYTAIICRTIYSDNISKYKATICTTSNPFNCMINHCTPIYALAFDHRKSSVEDREEELRRWYERTCLQLNNDFIQLIGQTYLEEV